MRSDWKSIPCNIFRGGMITHLSPPTLEEIFTRLLQNIQCQVTVGRGGSNQREIAVSAPVRFRPGMANLLKWWVKFKVIDRKKKKTWVTDAKQRSFRPQMSNFSDKNQV